jgi:hypothetical protein
MEQVGGEGRAGQREERGNADGDSPRKKPMGASHRMTLGAMPVIRQRLR